MTHLKKATEHLLPFGSWLFLLSNAAVTCRRLNTYHLRGAIYLGFELNCWCISSSIFWNYKKLSELSTLLSNIAWKTSNYMPFCVAFVSRDSKLQHYWTANSLYLPSSLLLHQLIQKLFSQPDFWVQGKERSQNNWAAKRNVIVKSIELFATRLLSRTVKSSLNFKFEFSAAKHPRD